MGYFANSDSRITPYISEREDFPGDSSIVLCCKAVYELGVLGASFKKLPSEIILGICLAFLPW